MLLVSVVIEMGGNTGVSPHKMCTMDPYGPSTGQPRSVAISLAVFYHTFALNKRLLTGRGFDYKESLYKWTARAAFENAKLDNATVVLDKSGNREFRDELAAYLRKRLVTTDGSKAIHKLKIQRSDGNNLLQLADYVASVSSRAVTRKANGVEWRKKYLVKHEASARIWP
jgi:hypothetical protein